MDNQALRLLGSVALARAARGDEDVAALSVLKLFGSEASQPASEHALGAAGVDGLAASGLLRRRTPRSTSTSTGRLVRTLRPVVRRHHRRRHVRNPTQHHRPARARLAPKLRKQPCTSTTRSPTSIATITLNRPEAANAQNTELLDELDAAWTRAAEDNDVAVIILRANGKHFSAGHDLSGGGPVPDKITLEFIIQHEAGATSSTRCAGATSRSRRSPPCRAGASPAACCCAGRAT